MGREARKMLWRIVNDKGMHLAGGCIKAAKIRLLAVAHKTQNSIWALVREFGKEVASGQRAGRV